MVVSLVSMVPNELTGCQPARFRPSPFRRVTYSLLSGTFPLFEPVLKPIEMSVLVGLQLASLFPVPSVFVSRLIDWPCLR